jgi:hypothetical protein
MIGHRSAAIGLSVLSAILICALGAQSASAAKAVKTTAFTCVKGAGEKDFKDEHCDENVGKEKGEYGHVAIEAGKPTEVELTNEKVTESTKKSESAVLKSKVGGAKVTIECTVAKGKGTFVNEEIEKTHTGSGSGTAEMSSCTVKELAKCIVAEPIVAGASGGPVEGLGAEKNEMGAELIGSGAEETFATIEFKNKGAETCAVNGKSFPVKGSVITTSGPTTESPQTGKSTGATAVYTPKNSMQKLKLGPENAEFSLIATVRAVGGNPLSGTTVT